MRFSTLPPLIIPVQAGVEHRIELTSSDQSLLIARLRAATSGEWSATRRYRRAVYFAIDVAIFGLLGLTSTVRVLGMTIKSISSIGMAPSNA